MNLDEAISLFGLENLSHSGISSPDELNELFKTLVGEALEINALSHVAKLGEARDVILEAIRDFSETDSRAIQLAESKEKEKVVAHLGSSKKHTFITGKAGTGKSYLLSQIVQSMEDVDLAVVAPTGVAALNVNGETIHSFFGIGLGVRIFDLAWLEQVPDKTLRKIKELQLLIIDEVSMVGPDMIDVIDLMLRRAKKSQDVPFGGIRIIMFGDLLQLKPVEPREEQVKAKIREHYGSYWFFNAKVWEEASFEILELNDVERQKGDPEFIDVLSDVREGSVNSFHLDYLNKRVGEPVRAGANPIRLVKTNIKVAEYNETKMNELTGQPKVFKGIETLVIEGEDLRDVDWPVESDLSLKVGAQVMFAKNEDMSQTPTSEGRENKRWANGTLGVITAFTENGVMVRIGTNAPIEVKPSTWELIKHRVTEIEDPKTKKIRTRLKPVVVARYTQIPLKSAWAVTIHKAQGKTYDDVIIDLSGHYNNPGQTYVALSRVKQISGMTLTEPLTAAQIAVDSDASFFMKTRLILKAADL
jgi:ATP-dependent exoDNAse (exonuclease V) alpha subunit